LVCFKLLETVKMSSGIPPKGFSSKMPSAPAGFPSFRPGQGAGYALTVEALSTTTRYDDCVTNRKLPGPACAVGSLAGTIFDFTGVVAAESAATAVLGPGASLPAGMIASELIAPVGDKVERNVSKAMARAAEAAKVPDGGKTMGAIMANPAAIAHLLRY
jgi:hypothetical protein